MTEKERAFPVHSYRGYPGAPRYVRWSALNEEQAQRNHGQSLDRLAQRGGLSPEEIVFNVERRGLDWKQMKAITPAKWGEKIKLLEYTP